VGRIKKKGVFFTFIAVFIIILIVALVSTRNTFRYQQKSDAIAIRVSSMDAFIDDYEKDLQRELFIGGYRAFISMNSYVRDIEDYITDFDEVFSEIFINGTANGTEMDLMFQENQGASFNSWLERINDEVSKMNFEVFVEIKDINVKHVTPWQIRLNLNVSTQISDISGLANWDLEKIIIKIFIF